MASRLPPLFGPARRDNYGFRRRRRFRTARHGEPDGTVTSPASRGLDDHRHRRRLLGDVFCQVTRRGEHRGDNVGIDRDELRAEKDPAVIAATVTREVQD